MRCRHARLRESRKRKAPRPSSSRPRSRPRSPPWTRPIASAFLADLGLTETGLTRVIRAGYELLGLDHLLHRRPQGSARLDRRAGRQGPEAAGEIHTDFERGFIRAETIAFDDFVACNGEAGARDAGKLRSEGKDYVVQDGDVLLFRFNV